jgi:membrane protease YdiL (CAAX protease family)
VLAALSGSEGCGLLVAYAVLCRIDRRPWRDYGLGATRALSRFGQGALCGALMMALLVGGLLLTHAVRISQPAAPARTVIESGLQWAAIFLPAAFTEEMTFRAYPFLRAARTMKPVAAAIVTSVCFGLAHLANGGEALLGVLQVVAIGLVFSLAVWRTGSIWWAFGAHAAWNWTQSFVFGASNSGLSSNGSWLSSVPAGPAWLSGGATGPEGSLLALPVLALMAGIILFTLPQTPRGGSGKTLAADA